MQSLIQKGPEVNTQNTSDGSGIANNSFDQKKKNHVSW